MAFDAFVRIDGIEGESTDDKHQGWIEILSYCFLSISLVPEGFSEERQPEKYRGS